jgi:hypothetical protein
MPCPAISSGSGISAFNALPGVEEGGGTRGARLACIAPASAKPVRNGLLFVNPARLFRELYDPFQNASFIFPRGQIDHLY